MVGSGGRLLLWKMRRDLVRAGGQFLAVAVVLVLGTALFMASYMSFRNLKASVEKFYEQYRFAHLTVLVVRAPAGVTRRIQGLPGVQRVTGRISRDLGLELPGVEDRLTARIISLPARRTPVVNDVFMVSGSYFPGRASGYVLVEDQFARTRGLKLGDRLQLVVGGRKHGVRVVGTVGTPEFVYPIRSQADMLSPGRYFGVVFIPEFTAASLLGFEGAVNELALTVTDPDGVEEVERQVREILEPFGVISVLHRDRQVSNQVLQGEIKELEGTALALPILFFSVAAMVIYVLLARLVRNQHIQIGVLMALGYSPRQILFHYLSFALGVGAVGALMGTVLGTLLAGGMTSLYTQVFNLPVLRVRLDWPAMTAGVVLGVGFCLAAAFYAVRKETSTSPATALRPRAAAGSRASPWEGRIPGIGYLSLNWRMAARSVCRNLGRTAITTAGVSLAAGLIIVTLFFVDAMDFMVQRNFGQLLTYDLKATFNQPVSTPVAVGLGDRPGVLRAEPLAEIPARFIHGWRQQEGVLTGITTGTDSYRLEDAAGRPARVPTRGILLSQRLANQLGVAGGDTLTVRVLVGRQVERRLRVVGLVRQYVGAGGFVSLSQAGRLLDGGPTATGAMLTLNPGASSEVKRDLLAAPGVAMVEERSSMAEAFGQYLELFYAFIGFGVIFAGIMAFAVIFNTTLVGIMERRRELASMRVIGMGTAEVSRIILVENLIAGLAGILLGVPFGRLLAGLFLAQVSSELFALPLVIYPRTYLLATLLALGFILLAHLPGRRQVAALNLVEAFKTLEE